MDKYIDYNKHIYCKSVNELSESLSELSENISRLESSTSAKKLLSLNSKSPKVS